MDKKQEKKEPIFRARVEETYENGDFKSSVTAELREWNLDGRSGHYIMLTKNKAGVRSSVSIDPSNDAVKKLLLDAYDAFYNLEASNETNEDTTEDSEDLD